MLKIRNAVFVKSIIHIKDRPNFKLPEFAFIGRSNVGKSSLINCLINRKNFARISKKPGKTRTINYYLINNSLYFVDLPGYGFAPVSKKEKMQWGRSIENYILSKEHYVNLFVLIDSSVGPQKKDYQLFEWLIYNQIDYQLILTKSDKVSKNILQNISKDLSDLTNLPIKDIIHFSSKTKKGREEILDRMVLSI